MSSDRLLSILLILSNKGKVTGKELADHFEVSLRTIYRDIDKICQAGIPLASSGGKGGGYYIMESYNLENLFFDKNEIRALMPLMDNLEFLFGKNKQFNDVVLKLKNTYKNEKMDNEKLIINMSHFSMEEELKEYLFLINKAIEENRLLKFNYINRRMESLERIAEPMYISFSHGEWYLSAYCRNRNDYRRFKLVRMRNIELEGSFIKKDITKEELEKIFDDSYDKNSIKITLKFSNKIGEQLTEYFCKDEITTTKEGNYIVEGYYPHDEGLIKFILGFGTECEVLEPKDFRKEIKEYINNLKEKYND